MSGDFLEASRPLLAWVGRTTVEASLIALLVLLAQWLLRGRVSARWRYNLWLLVVARLLLPAVPGSKASPFNYVRVPVGAVKQRLIDLPAAPQRVTPAAPAPAAPSPRRETGIYVASAETGSRSAGTVALQPDATEPPVLSPLAAVGGALVEDVSPAPQPRPVSAWDLNPPRSSSSVAPPSHPAAPRAAGRAPTPPAVPWYLRVNWYAVAALTWVAGAAFVATRLAWVSLRLALAVRNLRPVTDPALLTLRDECARQLRMNRVPRLLRAPDTFGPALVGLLRPRVLLPDCVIGSETRPGSFHRHEVRLILTHELAHMKRWDVAANWLLAALGVLHWFNPVLWLAFRRMRADRELACDEAVLAATGRDAGRFYGPTILKLLQALSRGGRPVPMPGVGMVGVLEGVTEGLAEGILTGFANPKSSIRRRIAMIARFDDHRRPGRGASALGVSLSLLVGGVAFTGAVNGQQLREVNAQVAGRTDDEVRAQSDNPAPEQPESEVAAQQLEAQREAQQQAAEAAREAAQQARDAAQQARDAAHEVLSAAQEKVNEAQQAVSERQNAVQEATAEADRALQEARQQLDEQRRSAKEAIEQAKQSVAEVRQGADQHRDEATQALEEARQHLAEVKQANNDRGAEADKDGDDADARQQAADEARQNEEEATRQVNEREQALQEALNEGEQAVRDAVAQVQEAARQQEQAVAEAQAAVEQAAQARQSAVREAVAAVQQAVGEQQAAAQGLGEAHQQLAQAETALAQAARPDLAGELPPATPPEAPEAGAPAPVGAAPPQAEPPAALPAPVPVPAPAPTPAPPAQPEGIGAGPVAAAPAPGAAPATGVLPPAAPRAGFPPEGALPPTAPRAGAPAPGAPMPFQGYGGGYPGQNPVYRGQYPGYPGRPGPGPGPGYPGMGGRGAPNAGAAAGRIEDPASRNADAQALAALQRPAPVDFNNIPLAEALDSISNQTGIDVVPDWRALEGAGVNRDAPVTLRIRQAVPAEQVLTWLLRSADNGDVIGFAIDHGVVVVAPRERLDLVLITRAYDLGPNLAGAGKSLEQLVRESVAPPSWRDGGGTGTVRVFNGKLFVTATEPNQRQVERLLGLMNAHGMGGAGGGGLQAK